MSVKSGINRCGYFKVEFEKFKSFYKYNEDDIWIKLGLNVFNENKYLR